jgi:hypothetical protein
LFHFDRERWQASHTSFENSQPPTHGCSHKVDEQSKIPAFAEQATFVLVLFRRTGPGNLASSYIASEIAEVP